MSEMDSLIKWFKTAKRIPEPFTLKWVGSKTRGQCVGVIVPERFYASIEREIELGSKHPRWRNGALEEDLGLLKVATEEYYKSVT